MTIAASPDWRTVAKSVFTRILQRAEDTERETAEEAERGNPQRAQYVTGSVVETRDLPPLDFATGRPVEVKNQPSERTPQANPPAPPRPTEQVSVLADPVRQRTRNRYIAARFPGVARSSGDLARPRAVVKAAYLYFGDGDARRAGELLDLAITLQPGTEALHLARLDLAFKQSDAESYRRTAINFRNHHPGSARWGEIVVFARSLCLLSESPFAEYVDTNDSYQEPRWLHESWELEPEFAPRDLRRRILKADEPERTDSIKREAA